MGRSLFMLLTLLATCVVGCGDDGEDAGLDDAGGDSGSDTGGGTDLGFDTDTWPTEGCVGQLDFTPCSVLTSPDRSYDICVKGKCVSPGCGDVTCNVPGPHFPLADTNQRKCYGAPVDTDTTDTDTGIGASEIACPSAGEELYGEDAQYGWDVGHDGNERFTRDDDPGSTGQAIVTDNVTGLEWQGCVAGQSGSACETGSPTPLTWDDALAYCDALDQGGKQDWHLPDEFEIQSIIDYGRHDPTIDLIAFPATVDNQFWSSTSVSEDSSLAWTVEFALGGVDGNYGDKKEKRFVRCVRPTPTPQPIRFMVSSPTAEQPVVLDNITGLEWQGCTAGLSGDSCNVGSVGIHTWQQALAFCEDLHWGGHTDWRLPDVKELRSIVDSRRTGPAIDPSAFPATPPDDSSGFWSSTSVVFWENAAWWMRFYAGEGSFGDKNNIDFASYVRCVRTGS
jgi:hypothetical protein